MNSIKLIKDMDIPTTVNYSTIGKSHHLPKILWQKGKSNYKGDSQ